MGDIAWTFAWLKDKMHYGDALSPLLPEHDSYLLVKIKTYWAGISKFYSVSVWGTLSLVYRKDLGWECILN